jgi:adenylate cyclase
MQRRLSAILAADMVGYSRLMAADEQKTIARQKEHRAALIDPKFSQYGGRIVKTMGDGLLVEFSSAVDAVQCALEIQRAMVEREAGAAEDRRIRYRVGINLGDISIDGDDVLGDGVNVAARLESLAKPGGICISDIVYQTLQGNLAEPFADIGEQALKNMSRKVRVWQWSPDEPAARSGGAPPLSAKPSIAVLPFTNMSGDSDQEYFSDGITEDIITELSRFPDLFVVARNSSFSYKGIPTKVQDIGNDLGVGYVVEGSVRKAAQRVRVTVQLIEVESGNHIWAERYDRDLRDIFELQDEITRTIAAVLPIRLQGALIESARKKPSENLSAYDYYLRARWLFDRTNGRLLKVLDLLSEAIRIDPECAHAYAMKARVEAYSVFTFSPIGGDPIAKALEDTERALSLGSGDHYIHTMAAHVYLTCGQFDQAKLHSEKALALNPNDFSALVTSGFITAYLGDHERGIDQMQKAMAHDPLAPDNLLEDLAEAYYLRGDYVKAIEIYQRWQSPPVHMYTHLAACYAQLNQWEDVRRVVSVFEKERPKDADFAYYAEAHARICKLPEDADHWLDGYRKAGLLS